MLLGGDLTAFPHLLELGSAVLEPDFNLCGKKEKRLSFIVQEPGQEVGRIGTDRLLEMAIEPPGHFPGLWALLLWLH